MTILATPTINGTEAGQAISDQQTIAPFTGVAIADTNIAQTETLTVTLSAAANGTLTNLGGGAYNTATGVYTVTGAASAVTAALVGLVFTPTLHQVSVGQAVTTGFTIGDIDTASQSATDSTTTVVATAIAVPPTISGTGASQTITDQTTISPFAQLVIADANIDQTETVTVTLSAAANGTLTNLGGGTYNAAAGVYTVTGTASQVTATLNALVFTPTQQQVETRAGGHNRFCHRRHRHRVADRCRQHHSRRRGRRSRRANDQWHRSRPANLGSRDNLAVRQRRDRRCQSRPDRYRHGDPVDGGQRDADKSWRRDLRRWRRCLLGHRHCLRSHCHLERIGLHTDALSGHVRADGHNRFCHQRHRHRGAERHRQHDNRHRHRHGSPADDQWHRSRSANLGSGDNLAARQRRDRRSQSPARPRP